MQVQPFARLRAKAVPPGRKAMVFFPREQSDKDAID